jgi:hypothetical protein
MRTVDGLEPTAAVPAFGDFMSPVVTACHISSEGISFSVHKIVNKGESHRTMEEGSSYRTSRFSKLSLTSMFQTL